MIMRLEDFLYKYEINVSSINTALSQHKNGIVAKSMITYSNRDGRFIDETPIKRRLEFAKRVWLESHDNYYALSEHFAD